MMIDISGPHLPSRTILADTLASDAESDLTPLSPKSSDYTYSQKGKGSGKAASLKNGGRPIDQFADLRKSMQRIERVIETSATVSPHKKRTTDSASNKDNASSSPSKPAHIEPHSATVAKHSKFNTALGGNQYSDQLSPHGSNGVSNGYGSPNKVGHSAGHRKESGVVKPRNSRNNLDSSDPYKHQHSTTKAPHGLALKKQGSSSGGKPIHRLDD